MFGDSLSQIAWNDARTEALKKMWSEGYSAGRIAQELGGITRNAVAGKVDRLGLTRSPTGPRQPGLPRAKRAAPRIAGIAKLKARPKPEVRAKPIPVIVDDAIPLEQRRTVVTIKPLLSSEANECRFIVGCPGDGDWFFCGGVTDPGEAYCPGHRLRVVDNPATRRSQERADENTDAFRKRVVGHESLRVFGV